MIEDGEIVSVLYSYGDGVGLCSLPSGLGQ